MDKKALAKLEHKITSEEIFFGYCIKASVVNLDNEKILFLSFFKDIGKANFKVFIFKDEYISQKLEKDGSYKWSKACIENLIGYWPYQRDPSSVAACYTLKERELIEKYLNIECLKAGDELPGIVGYQRRIMDNKLKAKYDKIKVRIDAAMAKVPELPKDFDKWVENGPFGLSRYIYYKREGKTIKAYCTSCNMDIDISETNHTKKNIKHNNTGTCPECKRKITYKATGKSTLVTDDANFAIMQKYGEGFIVRHFSGRKSYKQHYKTPKLTYWENVREIYEFDKEGVLNDTLYEYADFFQTNECRWCDEAGKFGIPKSYFYTKNLKDILKGTKWEYSCMYDYAKQVKFLYASKFLTEYIKHPQLEYLIKFKLYNLVFDYLTGYSLVFNFEGKGIKEVLDINKQMVPQIQRLNLNNKGLGLIRTAMSMNKQLTDHQIKWILNNVNSNNFLDMMLHTTPHKIIKYAEAQANKKYNISNVLSDWCDYIRQCKSLKFDLNNTFILFPKNLKEKHDEYIIANKTKDFEKYNTKVKKTYQKLNEYYSNFDKKFSIRPASSVEEIVKEGHELRHCVGGTQYIKGVADGDKAIMVIREIEAPEVPFYTLELNLNTLAVSQVRGFKNCDMTDDIKKFVEKWKNKKLTEEMLKVI